MCLKEIPRGEKKGAQASEMRVLDVSRHQTLKKINVKIINNNNVAASAHVATGPSREKL